MISSKLIGSILLITGAAIAFYFITVAMYCAPQGTFNANCVNVFHPIIAAFYLAADLALAGIILLVARA